MLAMDSRAVKTLALSPAQAVLECLNRAPSIDLLLPGASDRREGPAQKRTQPSEDEQWRSRVHSTRSPRVSEAAVRLLCNRNEAGAYDQWLEHHKRQRTRIMKQYDEGRARGGWQTYGGWQ